MIITDEIPKITETLEERGLPRDSYFEVTFFDGSEISEKECNWSSFSTKRTVEYFGNTRELFICNYQVKKIRIVFGELEAVIEDIPEDVEVYQFIRSETLLAKDINNNTIVGRGIGLIKDGSVVEERFISALENRVMGIRK